MKIGIMGGSFDPIHNGHLILAEQARVEAGLAQVVFMPTYLSPFKQYTGVTAASDRLAMVSLATESNPYFTVSDMEIQRRKVSYTAETLREYRNALSEDTELCFITGADAFLDIESWREADYLLTHLSFIVGLRPGFEEEKLDRLIAGLEEKYRARVTKVYSPKVDISSSHIRELLLEGKSPRYLLPETAFSYIKEKGLYGPEVWKPIKERIARYIQENLKPNRYQHTLGVAGEAAALARRYGADPEKAELCALFHDSCRSAGNLQHGRLAAELMKQDYNIMDQDMINAVEYHTTGREGMSLLEKILYVADGMEPSRDYPGVSELRRLAYEDLDAACLYAMEHTISYVTEQGLSLDENTVKARDFILECKKKGKKHG